MYEWLVLLILFLISILQVLKNLIPTEEKFEKSAREAGFYVYEEKDWEKEVGKWQEAARYWKERYLERDEYSEKLEEKLEKINETLNQEPDRGCMDTVIGGMKECVNCNYKVPAEFARCPECNKSTDLLEKND